MTKQTKEEIAKERWERAGRPRFFFVGGTYNCGRNKTKLNKHDKKMEKRRKRDA